MKFSKLAQKFQQLKGDPRYCAAFMLVILLWYLWDRVHNPLFPNLELFLSIEASLGTFMLYQSQGQKSKHDLVMEKHQKETNMEMKAINKKLDKLLKNKGKK